MGKKKATPEEVGKRLTELRGIRTRTGVARATEMSYSALYMYETGQRNPPPERQKRLADYYGVSVESIFYAHEQRKKR